MDTAPSKMTQDRAYGYFRHNSGKKIGASRAEVESAVLCGLAPLGISLSYAYQVAMSAYDSE